MPWGQAFLRYSLQMGLSDLLFKSFLESSSPSDTVSSSVSLSSAEFPTPKVTLCPLLLRFLVLLGATRSFFL